MLGLGGEFARHDGGLAQDSVANSRPCELEVHPAFWFTARFRRIGAGYDSAERYIGPREAA